MKYKGENREKGRVGKITKQKFNISRRISQLFNEGLPGAPSHTPKKQIRTKKTKKIERGNGIEEWL